MAGTIWEFFGYKADDKSEIAAQASSSENCPIIDQRCQKSFNDNVVSGVCAVKPMTSNPVICCPIRLYANHYKVLHDVSNHAFGGNFHLERGDNAIEYTKNTGNPCVAVFGQGWGGELRLPKKSGVGSYFVDWVLAKISENGELLEFIAVEVQTIDTTGSYRSGYEALKSRRAVEKTTVGLNWENVAKRILPQLIYKGQVLQREEQCKSGLYFLCPEPVLERILQRLGGQERLVKYALQPASITFLAYDYDNTNPPQSGEILPLKITKTHSTTVYKLQEAFNNVTLPDENVYRNAVLNALEGNKPNEQKQLK